MTSPLGQNPNAADQPRWFVAQAKPSKEAVAIQNLTNQGIAAFCPWMTTMRRVGNRTVPSRRALFPSYIFVRFVAADFGWRSVNGTLGVIRLLATGDRPLSLPEGFVEGLLARADGDDVIQFDEYLKKGASVRIVGGPFDQLCGKLLTEGPRERVHVLLDTLFGETRVKIARGQLLAA